MTTPSVVLTGYPPCRVPPSTPPPGRVPLWAGYPPARYPPGQGTPPAGPGRVPPHPAGPGRVPPPPGWTWQGTPPPGVCPMAFWEMLQSIMGTPPCGQTDGWKDRRVSKHYLPVVLRTRAVTKQKHFILGRYGKRSLRQNPDQSV